jgi:hypothetical protein
MADDSSDRMMTGGHRRERHGTAKEALLGRSRDGEFRCRYGLMPVAKSLIDALAASA